MKELWILTPEQRVWLEEFLKRYIDTIPKNKNHYPPLRGRFEMNGVVYYRSQVESVIQGVLDNNTYTNELRPFLNTLKDYHNSWMNMYTTPDYSELLNQSPTAKK